VGIGRRRRGIVINEFREQQTENRRERGGEKMGKEIEEGGGML
jgi:hypothetical protein